MADEYVVKTRTYPNELPVRVRRSPQLANAVVCLSKRGVVNERTLKYSVASIRNDGRR